MRFRKISRKDSRENMRMYPEPLVDEIMAHSKYPKLLLIDECVRAGKTKKKVTSLLKNISHGMISFYYSTLLGDSVSNNSDFYCVESDENKFIKLAKEFRNNPKVLGIDYKDFESIPIKSREMKTL